jgi:hypothetical protein
MSDELYFIASLTKEQREEIELLEMKACMALLDDQIIQLRRFKDSYSDLNAREVRPPRLEEYGDEYDDLMASVAQSTSLATQLNARALLTISERSSHGAAHAN